MSLSNAAKKIQDKNKKDKEKVKEDKEMKILDDLLKHTKL